MTRAVAAFGDEAAVFIGAAVLHRFFDFAGDFVQPAIFCEVEGEAVTEGILLGRPVHERAFLGDTPVMLFHACTIAQPCFLQDGFEKLRLLSGAGAIAGEFNLQLLVLRYRGEQPAGAIILFRQAIAAR